MKKFKLILDIGTTVIKGFLLDAENPKKKFYDFTLNEQIKYGEDVITRIDFALASAENAKTLKNTALVSINALIKKLLKLSNKSGNCDKRRPLIYRAKHSQPIKFSDIKEAVIVCNTAMHHLLLGISPRPLITPPYKAMQKSEVVLKAEDAGIKIYPHAKITILPNIGGFVGSDALALIIASGIHKSSSFKLGIDIGTNGEIVLGNADQILVTSTAAGPAFEGRHISCGMPAIEGAIEKIKMLKNNKIKISVIGNKTPKGICPSAIIDATAQMLRLGIIDKTGRMKDEDFTLFKKGKARIFITQADIRKIQLAKAAIYSGIKLLMRKLDIDNSEISEIFITGSFGNSINPRNIITAGLVPKVSASIVKFIKYAALTGAKEYIESEKTRSELTSILSRIKRMPLARLNFNEVFADSMSF